MSISVHHISRLYGTQKALNDVSFSVQPGEIIGFLGPNGAGKSTMMKILTGYLSPSAGSATVCGFDVTSQSMEVRKRIGYLPENNPLYSELYVTEALQFIMAINHGEAREGGRAGRQRDKGRISAIIEMTGLEAEQHKKIGALSRGYRQRVGLAQALLHDPEVLILDEPTSGLDPNQLTDIRHLILEIGKEKTIMLSTHIMQEVEAICDRTIIIHQGVIVADDKTENLRKLQGTRDIIKVEFDQPVARTILLQIRGIISARGEVDGRTDKGGDEQPSAAWLLESASDTDIRPVLFQFAVDNGLTVLSLQREEQRLEKVFQELTR